MDRHNYAFDYGSDGMRVCSSLGNLKPISDQGSGTEIGWGKP